MKTSLLIIVAVVLFNCSSSRNSIVQDVSGRHVLEPRTIWLSHEHILVDFIGADSITKLNSAKRDEVFNEMLPYLKSLQKHNVTYFVDATPNYLGRDVRLLRKLSHTTGIKIITNTGLYGARKNKFIPDFAKQASAQELATMWTDEFKNGIDGTSVKPGFIKIGVNSSSTLSTMDEKLIRAAALTHLETGLTIASHTGAAKGLWPQLGFLKELGVSPNAFIWVHSQNEKDNENYLKAAKEGCWISLDGLGWEINNHIEKIVFAKENGFLDQILISHDAGWYDPQKEIQSIKPYTAIFEELFPALKERGFSEDDIELLVSKNPSKAFSIKVRKLR